MSDLSDDPRRRARRRITLITVAVVVLAATVAAVLVLPGILAPRPATHRPVSLGPTVAITREDLTVTADIDGTLGFGEPAPVSVKATGTITWLPAVGQSLDRGATLARVDDKPVLVFLGDIPLYRPLDTPGMTGPDVSMAAANLVALGLLRIADPAKARVDARFQSAVSAYQRRSGIPVDGIVTSAWIHVLPSAGRVSSVSARLGDAPGDQVLAVTGTAKSVLSTIDPTSTPPVAVGTAVTVVLPSGAETPGHVASVGTVVTESSGGAGGGSDSSRTPKLAVVTTIDDPAAVAALDSAPVTVRVPSDTRPQVLVAPIAALLSLREGGFALQRPDGTLLAVKTGLFAGDLVEVSGAGLQPGVKVVTAR